MTRVPRIRTADDLTRVLDPSERVLTLFSGGLDSTYLLHLLAERDFVDVVALIVDLGDDVDYVAVADLGAKLGAQVEVLDLRETFADEFVLPAIIGQAIYLGLHPISASLSRPLIALAACSTARRLGAKAILHTANQSQNTLRRINGALDLLGFDGAFGSPYELSPVAREDKQAALAGVGLDEFGARAFSGDSNLWCREFESGALDDPEHIVVPAELYKWTASQATTASQDVTIGWELGRPVALDGETMGLVELIDRLNWMAGRFGLGRYTGLEHLASGEKALEVREMPAAQVLLAAYRQLESATIDAETIREKMRLEQVWVREAVEGRWYGCLRDSAQQFITTVGAQVTGSVTAQLSWRSMTVTSVVADRALYLRDREAWERERVAQGLTVDPPAAAACRAAIHGLGLEA